MLGNLQAEALHPPLERLCRRVVILHLSEHDVLNEEAPFTEDVHQPEHILLIGDSEIRSDFGQ